MGNSFGYYFNSLNLYSKNFKGSTKKMIMGKVSVIIPAFNEEQHIENVLRKIPRNYETVVVNDGSTDNTRKIAERFATKVVNHPRRMGKGAACRAGVKHTSNNILIFIDGDDQFEPSEITRLLKTLKKPI